MQIGALILPDPVIALAPLAGYGDVAFRKLCREYGASLTVTEMVSAKGLVYGNEKTETLLTLAPNETPSCVQLFGSDPDCFYKAVSLPALDRFDMIDINMGCPVPKITKCGEGSALMRDAARAADIVRACVAAAKGRPVTVKHRLGLDDDHIVAPAFAARMQEAGAAAVTVHGRTAAQGYRGQADWQTIACVARETSIPVLGNGDVTSRRDALTKMQTYGCAGVAIGRGALGRPDVFADERAPLSSLLEKHLAYALAYFPEHVAVRTMRKHFCRYLAGVTGTKALRAALSTAQSAAHVRELLQQLPPL